MNATDYWTIAHRYIKEGLITIEECRTIARVGHRKQPYWNRHIRDLEAICKDRREEKQSECERLEDSEAGTTAMPGGDYLPTD